MINTITKRELQIISLMMEEKSAKEIAVLLNLEPKTVESHKRRLMKRFGVKSSIGIILYAISSGFIELNG
ncbi:response regulator transcription factor [Fluviicola chungangensis]|uniref:Helix-turn-helix transcriptional regulator n=1 Tax=Fluviicola chungangensis TaxID=2597671 RepID=A0A556MPZ1_9FLAO|nr:helix-turn-helix transcriptional regulator [Fluviicola chungangensis]TSJ42017.1 helix-turn-helix transcriptional regulator [Fluviicola chungangensis]